MDRQQRRTRMRSLLLVLTTLACAETRHTPTQYRDDPRAAAALSQRASEFCAAENPDRPAPVRRFLTDGCSVWFDAEWNLECCVEHDIRYWCGGSPEQRAAADDALAQCIGDRTNEVVGSLVEPGLRVGGHPLWPMPYRWGYGHAYEGGYPSLEDDSR